jgi:hypothetical protein
LGAVVDLVSDEVADAFDAVPDPKSLDFLEDIIVTPVNVADESIEEADGEGSVKRNLSKTSNSASRRQGNKRLKPM